MDYKKRAGLYLLRKKGNSPLHPFHDHILRTILIQISQIVRHQTGKIPMLKFICQKRKHGISEGIPEHEKRSLSVWIDGLDPILLCAFYVIDICIDWDPS